MTLKQHLVQGSLWMSVLAALSLSAVGCDDSNKNSSPDDTDISTPKGGKSGSSSAGKGGSGDAGKASAGKGGSGDAGKASAGKGGAGGAGGASAEEGEPVDINAETSASCDPFDNSKLTKWKNGEGPAPELP